VEPPSWKWQRSETVFESAQNVLEVPQEVVLLEFWLKFI
jgi:hypothetical protein